jgi:hypothetical protein
MACDFLYPLGIAWHLFPIQLIIKKAAITCKAIFLADSVLKRTAVNVTD